MADTRAFPWAADLDADQLEAFIEDLWGAASGSNDLDTLDAIETVITEHRPSPLPCPLSDRELAILTELANGETYEAASRNLGLTTESVRSRCSQIYARLGARNAAQAAAIGTHHGWLPGLLIPEPTEEPPRILHGPTAWNRRYRDCVRQMRKSPGTSVEIGPYGARNGARNAARHIRRGEYRPFEPAGAFDAQAVPTGQGTWIVRARFLGDPADTTADVTERTAS